MKRRTLRILLLAMLGIALFSLTRSGETSPLAQTVLRQVFTESGTFKVPDGVTSITVLIVAGGGAGGSHTGGGGGAGGLAFVDDYPVIPNDEIPVVVGSGGIGGTGLVSNGSHSSFGELIALGGGGGGWATTNGASGGSAGGGGYNSNGGSATQVGSSSGGFGNVGGKGTGDVFPVAGAGGGGARSAGTSGTSSKGGDGGSGKYYGDIFGEDLGDNGWFAGGGGGASELTPGSGGKGGGANAGPNVQGTGGHAVAHTGGGGGGARGGSGTGGNGGSGVVIVQWLAPASNTTPEPAPAPTPAATATPEPTQFAPALFSPTDISGLENWLKADAGVLNPAGLLASDSEKVATWKDQSPKRLDVKQSIDDKRPTFRTNQVNGLPAVKFDGVNDLLTATAGTDLAQPNTVFAVLKWTSVDPKYRYFTDGAPTHTTKRHILAQNSSGNWVIGSPTGVHSEQATGPDVQVMVAIFDSPNSKLRIDGAEIASGATATQPFRLITLGSQVEEYSGFFEGLLLEFGVYDHALSPTDIEVLEKYLTERWDPVSPASTPTPTTTSTPTASPSATPTPTPAATATVEPTTTSKLLEDDFNQYCEGPLTGQGGWSGPTAFWVQRSVVREGAEAIASSGSNGVMVSKTGNQVADGKLTFYLMSNSVNGYTQLRLYEEDTPIALYRLGSYGQISHGEPSGWVDEGPYNSYQWYQWEVEWRSSDKKFRHRIDGGPWIGWYSSHYDFTNYVDTVKLVEINTGGQTSYFDYIAEEPVSSQTQSNTPICTSTPVPTPTSTPVPEEFPEFIHVDDQFYQLRSTGYVRINTVDDHSLLLDLLNGFLSYTEMHSVPNVPAEFLPDTWQTPGPTATPDSNAPAILSPEWGETISVELGQTLSEYVDIQEPPGTTHFCYRGSGYSGQYPIAPQALTINDLTCEIRWTPSDSDLGIDYEVSLRVDFWLPNSGSASQYVTFRVMATNNPPTPTPAETATPTPSSEPTLEEIKAEIQRIVKLVDEMTWIVEALDNGAVTCPIYYTVQINNTLSGIALHYYGEASYWVRIYYANQLTIGTDPNLISPGQILCVPGPVVTTEPKPAITYELELGESIYFDLGIVAPTTNAPPEPPPDTIIEESSGDFVTYEEIKQWTKENRIRIFFGVGWYDPSLWGDFIAALRNGEIQISRPSNGPLNDPSKEKLLNDLSHKCFPTYPVSGFGYVFPPCSSEYQSLMYPNG